MGKSAIRTAVERAVANVLNIRATPDDVDQIVASIVSDLFAADIGAEIIREMEIPVLTSDASKTVIINRIISDVNEMMAEHGAHQLPNGRFDISRRGAETTARFYLRENNGDVIDYMEVSPTKHAGGGVTCKPQNDEFKMHVKTVNDAAAVIFAYLWKTIIRNKLNRT